MGLVLQKPRNKNSKKEEAMEMPNALELRKEENLALWGHFYRLQREECESWFGMIEGRMKAVEEESSHDT